MRINFLLIFLFVQSISLHAQYYYKDILSTQQTKAEHTRLKTSGFRNIKIESFEDDDSPAEGFRCEKKVSKDFLKTTLQTKLPEIGYSILQSTFDSSHRIIFVNDSSELSLTKLQFQYDASGKLQSSKAYTKSTDDDLISEHTEIHQYLYDSSGNPEMMYLIKNNKDTTTILFNMDEDGNIAIEKNQTSGGKYYYYYDKNHRLTDIVHTSEFTTQLLPDYVMEYNDASELIMQVSFENGGKMKTKTLFDYEKGLKKGESIYINGKYAGKITYKYSK